MALFGGKRDVSLFRSVNRELIHRYIDTEVLVYKLNLINTTTNLYDETDSKVYDSATLIPSIVTLEDKNIPLEIGDVVEYQSRFFEIDSIVENQNVAGKDPLDWYGGDGHGYSVSVICQAHMTRQSKINIVQTRFGNSETIKDKTLPKNL